MKLLWLNITGIGPFSGVETIDFSAFEDSGLFLLEGPTGSGKSTIIDAIVFALYGDVARTKDASKDRLRSTRITDRDPSEVDLVFEVSAGIYRVTRTPAFTPEGKKTQRNSRATLRRVIEDSQAPQGWRDVADIASGPRDVGPELTRLIGLDKDQFLQTVVLPQGKFSQFLNASSAEREKILRDIFTTHEYTLFARSLSEQASASRALIDQASTRASASFDRLADMALSWRSDESEDSLLSPPSPEAVLSDDSSPLIEWGKSLVDYSAGRAQRATQSAHAAARRSQEADSALARGKADAADIAEAQRTREQLAALDAQSGAIAHDRERADASERARIVEGYASSERAACLALERISDQVYASTGLDSSTPLTAKTIGDLVEHWSRIDQEARREEARLEEAATLEAACATMSAQVERIHTQHDALLADIRTLEESQKELPAQLEAARGGVARMREDVRALPQLRVDMGKMRERLEAGQQADILRDALIGASNDLREATAYARLAAAAAADGHDLWITQTAASLAGELREDTPCPVCGSPTHPSPALSPTGAITREEVEELDVQRGLAEERLREAQEHHSSLNRRIAELNSLAGSPTPSLEVSLRELVQRCRALEEVETSLATYEAEINRATRALEEMNAQLGRRREQAAQLSASLSEREASLRDARERVAEATAGYSSLSERRRHCEERGAAARLALSAAHSWSSAFERHQDAHAALVQALSEQGMEPESWEHSLLDRDEERELRQRVTSYEAQLFAARESLASPRFKRALTLSLPDVQALEERATALSASRDQAQHLAGEEQQRSEQARAAVSDFNEALSSLACVRAQAGPVRRLADIANASGPENLIATPLSAWVLISRLDEVLAAANPRLLAISSGRYELVSVPDDDTRSRKSGLGLAILDHDTDSVRSPRTLSGGETFYTSLSLALGLADVVSAEAGGIQARTLFIDEGFGSLDSHTLSLVMSQLQALREEGRMVGVISHVEEMSALIPDQVQVRPLAEGGSHLRVRA